MKIHHSFLRVIALFIGAGCIFLGYDLFIKGVTGVASLVVNSKSLSGQLINAAPGLFFVFGGVVIIIVSLYKKVEEYRFGKQEGLSTKNVVPEMYLNGKGNKMYTREPITTMDPTDTLDTAAYLRKKEELKIDEESTVPMYLRKKAD